MSVYIYCGKDLYRQESALNTLLKKHQIDHNHTIVVDMSDKKNSKIESLLMECDTCSLFDDGMKAVIAKDPYFLRSDYSENSKILKTDSASVKRRKEKEKANADYRKERLETYIKNPNPNTLLIFLCHGFNADSRKADFKLLEKYGAEKIAFDVMNEDEFKSYASKELKKNNLQLSTDALNELLNRTGTDTLLFHNALEKLLLYGEKKYKLDDIRHLISLNPEVDIFELTAAFTNGDLSLAIETMNGMVNLGYDYTAMVLLIAKRLRMMYNVKKLYEKGYSNEDIAMRLKQKKGAVWYILKDADCLSLKKLLKYLNELAELDQGIKQGIVVPKEGFESFLIRNGHR